MAVPSLSGAGWREAACARLGLLAGRPVGVVGAGYVGRRVIGMLRALRAELLVYDPYLKDDLGASPVGLEELFAQSDVVTLHAPITPETRHMIRAEHLARLRDGAV